MLKILMPNGKIEEREFVRRDEFPELFKQASKTCECANLEWLPEHYELEHHPDCKKNVKMMDNCISTWSADYSIKNPSAPTAEPTTSDEADAALWIARWIHDNKNLRTWSADYSIKPSDEAVTGQWFAGWILSRWLHDNANDSVPEWHKGHKEQAEYSIKNPSAPTAGDNPVPLFITDGGETDAMPLHSGGAQTMLRTMAKQIDDGTMRIKSIEATQDDGLTRITFVLDDTLK